MRRLVVLIAVISAGALLFPVTAGAQGGSISGLVEDTTGGILPGVTVSADSPVNIAGTITAFTDGSGRYTITQLRPGQYTVTFTLPGFNTFIREGIVLSGDSAVQVGAEMNVGALEETVTVSGESPVVDVQQVRRQFVATRQMMDVLPAARTFSARALLIPGVRNTGMGEGQYWPSVHGSTWKDAQTMNDGMRANSTVDDGQWQMGWEMNDAATAELTFEAGGAPAEAQVGGVIQNAIPKEGGNTFSGTWFTYYGSGGMSSSNADPELRAKLGEVNRLAYDVDTNPAFGGRFIRDKLWFFTSFRGVDRKTYQAGTFFAQPGELDKFGQVNSELDGTLGGIGVPGEQAFSRSYSMTGLLRLTNQLTDQHKWRIGFERVNRQHPLNDTNAFRAPQGANRIMQPTGYHAQARWTSSISNRLLVEAGMSVQYNKWRRHGWDHMKMRSAEYELASGQWGGGFWIQGWQPERSKYAKGSISYVTGSHNFKAGMEHRWGNIGLDTVMPADVRTYYYYNQNPYAVDVMATPLGNYSGNIDFDTGLFAQDSWTLGNWTLNLGVRADIFSSSIPEQQAGAGVWVPERTFPRYPGPRWNTVVVRTGIAYDVFGDGRTALKGTMHQYVSSESTRIAMKRNPLSSFTWAANSDFRLWNDIDGNRSVIAPDGRIQYEEVGLSGNENFGSDKDTTTLVDLSREGHWEYALNLQHEIFSGISVTGGWYRRNYYNMWWEDNGATSHQNFSPFMITGPMDSRLVGGGGENIQLYNMDPSVYGLSEKLIRTGDLNDRLYDGFEFVIDGRMDNGAFFGGSYTYERTFLNECDVDNPNGLRFCDAPRAWQSMYKAHAAYPMPGGIILSGFVQGYPGPELNANYNVTAMADGTRLTGGQRITIDLLPPETYFLPFQRKVDIRLMRRFNIGNTQIAPVMDLFNLFNANTTTAVNSTYGSRWQEITTIMQSRYIRMGLEIDW
jgi:hypothetical protein